MKDSYIRTPRTLSSATFHTWGDPIDVPPRQEAGLGAIALTVLIVIAACAAGAYLIGG